METDPDAWNISDNIFPAMPRRASVAIERPKLPADIEKSVLVQCRRRCCLCVGLSGDFSEKAGQIAHLDGNRTNNAINNLAFLCLPHHDEYDSVTSQRKGLQRAEVIHYRKELYELIARAEQPAILALLQGKSDEDRLRAMVAHSNRAQMGASSDHELLAKLVSSAQAWYDDVITRLSIIQPNIVNTSTPLRLSFEYIWTRRFLPTVVGVTRALADRPAMKAVVREAETFIDLLTTMVPEPADLLQDLLLDRESHY